MARKKKDDVKPGEDNVGTTSDQTGDQTDSGDGAGMTGEPGEETAADMVKRNFTRRQDSLPGFGRAAIPELDEAALEFVTHRDDRMAAGEREKAAKKKLRGLVDKYRDQLTNRETGEVVYRFDAADGATQEVLLKPADVKLTVRRVDPESTPGSSGDD